METINCRLALPEHVAQRLFQLEIIRRAIKLLFGNLKWIQFFLLLPVLWP